MTERPRLSVVLPCRLAGDPGAEMRGALLTLTLVALDRQTVPRSQYEVVVVDDGGDADVADVIARSAAADLPLPLRVVRNPGPVHGQAAAYNVGLGEARGDLVLLTTDDSLLAPDALAAHLRGHARGGDRYLCGVERQYVYGVLFRNLITGALLPRGDLSVRAFGSLLGFTDLRGTAEQLGFTEWTVGPDDVRERFGELLRRSALTPGFRDMYAELAGDRQDLRWLCVRMGNHSVPRAALRRIGGVAEAVPGGNSDQDLGLRLTEAGIAIDAAPDARSVLLEHRRDLRSFADGDGLRRLAERWPDREDVRRLHEYFARGYHRSLADYRGALAAAAPTREGGHGPA